MTDRPHAPLVTSPVRTGRETHVLDPATSTWRLTDITVGFGAAERTFEGAQHLARSMGDLATGERADASPSERLFCGAARELLTVLVFCAAHGDLETTATVENWVTTIAATSTQTLLRERLRDLTHGRASTPDQRADARLALQSLTRRLGDTDDPRMVAVVQKTAINALWDWTRQQATTRSGSAR